MCHILGIEPQFENIIKNGPFIPMTAGQRKPEGQWTGDERKAANLDQRLKSLIMSVLPDDQMNSVINCLTAKSTWDDLILYHEGPSDVKESRVMNLKLCCNTFKFKEGETLTQTFTRYKALMNELVNDGIKLSKLEINTGFIIAVTKEWQSFCQSDDEEDTRSSQEYLNDLEEEYQARALLAKSKRFFKKGTQSSFISITLSTKTSQLLSAPKPELRPTKDFKAKYNTVKAKLALLSSSASASKVLMVKNKCLITEAYGWDEEEVSSDDNEMVEVKVLMALAEDNDAVSKDGAKNDHSVYPKDPVHLEMDVHPLPFLLGQALTTSLHSPRCKSLALNSGMISLVSSSLYTFKVIGPFLVKMSQLVILDFALLFTILYTAASTLRSSSILSFVHCYFFSFNGHVSPLSVTKSNVSRFFFLEIQPGTRATRVVFLIRITFCTQLASAALRTCLLPCLLDHAPPQ
ncbi:hypothetical protein Tco_0722659 [Tanacetum coccineum]